MGMISSAAWRVKRQECRDSEAWLSTYLCQGGVGFFFLGGDSWDILCPV